MNKYLSMNARDILYDMHHRVCLKVGDSYLRITECEYYPWDDVYTHRHPKQRERLVPSTFIEPVIRRTQPTKEDRSKAWISLLMEVF